MRRRVTLDPLLRPVIRLCEWLGVAIGAYFCVALFAAVVMRYVFNRSLGWIDELSSILLAWIMFVVGAVGFNEKVHIAAEGFVDRLPGAARRAVATAVHATVGGFFAAVGYYGWFVAEADLYFAMASIPLARGVFLFVIPAASAVVVLISINNVLRVWQPAPAGRTAAPDDALD